MNFVKISAELGIYLNFLKNFVIFRDTLTDFFLKHLHEKSFDTFSLLAVVLLTLVSFQPVDKKS